MSHVRYIDKTTAYYAKEGYEKPYAWAHFDEVPFTKLDKPLSECRLTLISTSDVTIKGEGDAKDHAEGMFLRGVYPLPSSLLASELESHNEHFDRNATRLDDVDSYFPITRLREAAAEGRIGSVAEELHGVIMNYSQRRTLDVDGPEVLERCRADGVDAAVMTPV
jgi:D-proline reductase (dithiol) PrdB